MEGKVESFIYINHHGGLQMTGKVINYEGRDYLVVETENPEAFMHHWKDLQEKLKENPQYKPVLFEDPPFQPVPWKGISKSATYGPTRFGRFLLLLGFSRRRVEGWGYFQWR